MAERDVSKIRRRLRDGIAIFCSCYLCAFIGMTNFASAYSIEKVFTEIHGDFTLTGAEQELSLLPGEGARRAIYVTNQTGEARDFAVTVEDVKGGNESQSVALLGDADGPYSLRKFITPEVTHFHLEQGEQITLPFTINIPSNAEAGGRFASILVSSSKNGGSINGTKLISRLGALIFVRIKGDVKESGYLEGFGLDKDENLFFGNVPSGFLIRYRNTGNVHDSLSGSIAIRNMAGVALGTIDIPAFYSLPGAVRYRHIVYGSVLSGGRYTASLMLDPGFGSKKIIESASFWVIPRLWINILAGSLILCALVVVRKKFQYAKNK